MGKAVLRLVMHHWTTMTIIYGTQETIKFHSITLISFINIIIITRIRVSVDSPMDQALGLAVWQTVDDWQEILPSCVGVDIGITLFIAGNSLVYVNTMHSIIKC